MRSRGRRTALAALALVVGLAACTASEPPGTATSETPGAPTSATPGVTVPPDAATDEVARLAVADLARRLKLGPDAIEIVQATRANWPDGTLGCPQLGRDPGSGPVDGYRIVLRHAGRVYVYPAGSDGVPGLCASLESDGGLDFVPPPGFDE